MAVVLRKRISWNVCGIVFYNQHVEEPTREQAILDWVLSNEEGLVSSLVVRGPLGKSDHNMVEFFIRMESDIINYRNKGSELKER